MDIFSYLPSLSELFSQVYADIGNPKIFWIIAFVSCLLVIHGVYVLAVVIFFHKLVNWLTAKKHITSDLLNRFRLASIISFFIAILLVIMGHILFIVMWTYALIPLKIFVSNPEVLYFAGEMYVTLGLGSYQIEKGWRILPIIIAFSGIFSASMSGAALFNMLSSLIDKSKISDFPTKRSI
jgi:hypothetical protein